MDCYQQDHPHNPKQLVIMYIVSTNHIVINRDKAEFNLFSQALTGLNIDIDPIQGLLFIHKDIFLGCVRW